MSAAVARNLKPVDALEVSVLVDNVVDILSTVPKDVRGEPAVLRSKGLKVSSGHARCCANHGLSLVITTRLGSDIQILRSQAIAVTRERVRFGPGIEEGARRRS